MCHPPAVDVDKHSDRRSCQVYRGVVFLESLLSIPCLGIYGRRFGWRNQISTLAMLRQLVIHHSPSASNRGCQGGCVSVLSLTDALHHACVRLPFWLGYNYPSLAMLELHVSDLH